MSLQLYINQGDSRGDISGAGAGAATILNIMAKAATQAKAFKVSYKLTNLKPSTDVKPLEKEVGEKIDGTTVKYASSLLQALKWAVDHCFTTLVGNTQFPTGSKIEFGYEGTWTTLPTAVARLFHGDEAMFNVKFDHTVETIFGGWAMKNEKLGEAYVRVTDKGMVFEGTKVTTKIVANQIVERKRSILEDMKWSGDDAKDSVHGKAERLQREARKLQYAKSQKELKESIQKLLGK